MRINFDNIYSIFGYGWSAYFEDGIITISYEAPREGGILYKGVYKGVETPYLNEIKREDSILYNSIVKYFEHIKE